jgi:hypothetical protein
VPQPPFEKWTQDDFWSFAAFFGRLDTKFGATEAHIVLKDKLELLNPKRRSRSLRSTSTEAKRQKPGRGHSRETRSLDHFGKEPVFARASSIECGSTTCIVG